MVRALSGLVRLAAGAVVRLVKAALLLVLEAGIPYGLLTQIGSPLPRHLPTTDQISRVLTGPVSDTLVLNVLALALWVLWAAFTLSVVVEVIAAVRGVPRPRLGPIAPLQTLAGGQRRRGQPDPVGYPHPHGQPVPEREPRPVGHPQRDRNPEHNRRRPGGFGQRRP